MADEVDTVEADPQAEQALLEMANQYDTTGQYEMPEEHTDPSAKPTEKVDDLPKPPGETPEEPQPELKPAAEEKTRDEKGRFLPKDGEKPPEAQPEVKPESPYTKAQKEEARKTKTWQQIESEKQAVRAEAARIQQERARFDQERQAAYAKNLPRAQKDGFTAPDYYKASQDFYKEGDFESAYKAMATANELVAYEQQYYAQENQKIQESAVMGQFQADLQKLYQKEPDAAWKQNMPEESQTPLAREINNILNERPYLPYFPEAAKGAYEIAQLRLEHFENIELRAENEKLRAEKTERDKASQPLRGGPTKPGRQGPIPIEEMTEEDMLRMAEEKDAGYG